MGPSVGKGRNPALSHFFSPMLRALRTQVLVTERAEWTRPSWDDDYTDSDLPPLNRSNRRVSTALVVVVTPNLVHSLCDRFGYLAAHELLRGQVPEP